MTKANANPTRAFFVRMLTRDISLEDCILDLVDNSIDGAWRISGGNPASLENDDVLSERKIDVSFDDKHFEIHDNCGGITFDDAVNYAFTFGRRDEQKRDEYSIGVYGIGMKRAVFKIGNDVSITSTFSDMGTAASFKVPIDVEAWVADTAATWDFDIDDAEPLAEPGVFIAVTSLTPETLSRLSDPTYARSLRRTLARDYMIPLMRGLTITVNGIPVVGWNLELQENETFAAMRERYKDGAVTVEIVAGMVAPPPDDLNPDDGPEKSELSGWYILCNGRVVLAADTSILTEWGAALPKWHKQYTGFAGLALFSSDDPRLLPMTTTKRSVDVSSAVYRRALSRMYVPTRAWITYTNTRKQNVDAARVLETQLRPVNAFATAPRSQIALPQIAGTPSRERMANVNYSVPLASLRLLATGFGDVEMSYRDVGLRSFDFAYEELADEA